MQEINNFQDVTFKNWQEICTPSYQGGKKITTRFGKIFFYTDGKKLFYENLNPFERILRILLRCLFHYHYKGFTKENCWSYLTTRKIVKGHCPERSLFRTTLVKRFNTFQIARETIFQPIVASKTEKQNEEEIIKRIQKSGLDLNTTYPAPHTGTPVSILYYATSRRLFKVASYLIEHNANVNTTYGSDTFFRLLLDTRVAHTGLALQIINKGLNLHKKTDKETPLILAVRSHNPGTFDAIPIIQKLLSKELPAPETLAAALAIARQKNHPAITQLLQ